MSDLTRTHYDLRRDRLPLALMLTLLMLPVRGLRADEVYKSVDAQGNITYSDRASALSAGNVPPQIVRLETAPSVLHFCWTNCFTLLLTQGAYLREDGSDEQWTIEQFNSHSVVLHRHDSPADWNGFSADVTYEGQVSGNRLVNVAVGGRAVPDIQIAWGDALHTLPGSNAERDRWNLPLVGTDPSAYAVVNQAPPAVPEEEQPLCPAEGFLWTPGYWAWRSDRYYWVTGAWVQPPRAGQLWTPGYWSDSGGNYRFHAGYWGPTVGYYGGINYGFGYGGTGFAGGRWVGSAFVYNTAVSHVGANLANPTYADNAAHTAAVVDDSRIAAGPQHRATRQSGPKIPKPSATAHALERNKT